MNPRLISRLGASVWARWDELRCEAAVVGAIGWAGARPRSWGHDTRRIFARQILTSGIESLGLVGVMAGFVGVSLVVQLTYWVGAAGQSQLLGPLLIAVVARELGPVLVNLVVIIRSGSTMTTELALLKISGEVGNRAVREGDAFLQLGMPRVLGMMVATFCLTIVFILVALASGYLFAGWMGRGSRDLFLFADAVSRAVQPKDVVNILAKGLLPALFAGAACCIGGLGTVSSLPDIPRATRRSLTRAVAGLFVISAGVSLLTYY